MGAASPATKPITHRGLRGSVRQRRGAWHCDFRDQYGTRRVIMAKADDGRPATREEAEEILRGYLEQVAGAHYEAPGEERKFPDLVDVYLEQLHPPKVRDKTRQEYEGHINKHLLPYFHLMKLRQMTWREVERFRAAMRKKVNSATGKPLSIETVNKSLMVLSAMFKLAERLDWITKNPCRQLESLRRSDAETSRKIDSSILTRDECVQLFTAVYVRRDKQLGELRAQREASQSELEACRTQLASAHGATRDRVLVRAAKLERRLVWLGEREREVACLARRDQMLLRVAIETGCRQGELFGLSWARVDFERRRIYIDRTIRDLEWSDPKTRRSRRHVYLTPALARDLKEWRLACPKAPPSEQDYRDLVFPNAAGGPESSQNFMKRHYRPILKAAGLKPIRFHDLRHTTASLLLAEGVNVLDVQNRLGHSSPTVTLNIYSHLVPGGESASVNALESMFGSGSSWYKAGPRAPEGVSEGVPTHAANDALKAS